MSGTDFIFFWHGVTLLITGTLMFVSKRGEQVSIRRFFLPFFCVLLGASEWTALFSLYYSRSLPLHLLRILLFLTAFIFLAEGMRDYSRGKVRWFYVYPPVCIAVTALSISGLDMLYSLQLGLAVPSLLLLTINMKKESDEKSAEYGQSIFFLKIFAFFYTFIWLIPSIDCLPPGAVKGLPFYGEAVVSAAVLRALSVVSTLSIIFIRDYQRFFKATGIRGRLLLPVLYLTIVIISFAGSGFFKELNEADMRSDVLASVRAIASGINPDRIKQLSFTADDKDNPAFIRVRKQMRAWGNFSGLKSIYTMKMVNGKLFFGPESIDETSPMASPPGTEYLSPDRAFINAWISGESGVTGPYTDEYGSFVSGYAPVFDRMTGQVLMLVGVDYDSGQWAAESAHAGILVFIPLMVLSLLLVIIMMAFDVRNRRPAESWGYVRRYLGAISCLATGLILSVTISFFMDFFEKRAFSREFANFTDSWANIIRTVLVDTRTEADELVYFIRNSEEITWREFTGFYAGKNIQPIISISWYPGVRADRKGAFERYMRSQGFAGYRIYRQRSDGSKDYNPGGDVLYPLAYAFPREYSRGMWGRDIGYICSVADIKISNFSTIVDAFRGDEKSQIMLATPVCKGGSFCGYILSEIDMNVSLAQIISYRNSINLGINIDLARIFEDGSSEIIAAYPGGSAEDGTYTAISRPHYDYPLFFGGAAFGISIKPSDLFIDSDMNLAGLISFAGGFFITILVSMVAAYFSYREQALESVIGERTRELESSYEQIQTQIEEMEAINEEMLSSNRLLSESEEKFSRAFNINPAIMIISDLNNGRFIDVNSSFLALTGYTRDQVMGKTSRELELFINYDEAEAAAALVMRDGAVKNLELAIKTSSGETRYGLFSADRITIKESDYLLSVMNDITDRKRFETALMESEEKYRLLFESSLDALFITEGNRIIDCNRAAMELFRCGREEIIGYTTDRFNPEFQPDGRSSSELTVEILDDVAGGKRQPFSWIHRTLDGIEFEAEVSLGTFRIEGKIFYFAIMRDVTERKKYEARINHMQKMDAMGQLAGGIAHDFNNQLGGIMGYAELLANKLEDDNLKKYAEGIVSVASRSAEMTKKLLVFSRKTDYNPVRSDIHSIIRDTVDFLEHSIDKKITVIQKLDAEHSYVSGDAAGLQNVFLNLGLNARDAMDTGGVLTYETGNVTISADDMKGHFMNVKPGGYLMIQVSDTGAGMSDQVKAHLFEPFFTTKPEGRGTGMGLASVYATVKNHGGSISVYSEEGMGTVFKLYLPLGEDDIENDKNVTAENISIPPKRILIVDDEKVIREILKEVLSEEGHTVFEAEDGGRAVELYKERGQEIDLVILDMIMPGMNGRETLDIIREINPLAAVIFSSGFDPGSIPLKATAGSASGFVHKPFQRGELLSVIAGVLRDQVRL